MSDYPVFNEGDEVYVIHLKKTARIMKKLEGDRGWNTVYIIEGNEPPLVFWGHELKPAVVRYLKIEMNLKGAGEHD